MDVCEDFEEQPGAIVRRNVDERAAKRPKYIHKRQASRSNETAVAQTARLESTLLTTTSIISSSTIVTSPSATTVTASVSNVLMSQIEPTTSSRTSSTSATARQSTGVGQDGGSEVSSRPPAVLAAVLPTSASSSAPPSPSPSISAATSSTVLAAAAAASAPAPVATVSTLVAPAASASAGSESLPSSILVNTSMATAGTKPIAMPTFAPIPDDPLSSAAISSTRTRRKCSKVSLTTPAGADASAAMNIQSGPAALASTTSSSAAGGATASLGSASASTGSVGGPMGSTQTPSTSLIAGAVGGSVAAFIILAILGVWCIRRRHRALSSYNTMAAPPGRSWGSPGSQRIPPSPPLMEKSTRPDPTTLFGNPNLSTIPGANTAVVLPAVLSPVFRHSRSFTTISHPPAVPIRSAARPPLKLPLVAPPPLSISRQTPPIPTEPTEPVNPSFMGTISTYFSPPAPASQPPIAPSRSRALSNESGSRYSISLYPSPRGSSGVASSAARNSTTSRNTVLSSTASTNSTIILPPLTSALSPPHPTNNPFLSRTSTAPNTTRFQSMGAWRDSMWSTSATPISGGRSPGQSGHASHIISTYFPRPDSQGTSHRGSRSLGDVLDWRSDDGVMPVARSPSREAWPLAR